MKQFKHFVPVTSQEISTKIRAIKDYSTFGGPNQWNIQYQRDDGWWVTLQWMGKGNAERIVGPLPEFKIFRGRVVPVKR